MLHRNGRFDCHEIEPDELDVREFSESKKIPLTIEDDGDTENIHTAYFVEFIPDKPGKIKIRWENGRKEEIDLSRICTDPSKRKRRATEFLDYNEDFSIKGAKARKKVEVDLESTSSEDDESIISSKARSARNRKKSAANGKLVLRGFSQSTTQLGENTFGEYLTSLLESMSLHNENSEEFTEILTDLNMIIQEKLHNIHDKTALSIDQPIFKKSVKKAELDSDDNTKVIIQAAKSFGLNNQQVDELFDDLVVDSNGFYSVNDAVPKILLLSQQQQKHAVSHEESGKSEDLNKRYPACLGSRVKTVFEDGTEHEGTIATVHYRVLYDDGDTETLSEKEVYENLVCNKHFISSKHTSSSMLELFSGCSLLSTLCKRRGMEVMSVDNDICSNATIKADFSSDYVQSLLSSITFDYLHASPVCSTHSHLAGDRHRSKENYNKSVQSHIADGHLMLLYLNIKEQLQRNPDCIVTIENPLGWMRKGNIMKELFQGELSFRLYQIFYCQFGRDEMKVSSILERIMLDLQRKLIRICLLKPTCIWTNDYKLGEILLAIGGKCKCTGNHKENVRDTAGKNFAALPMELCKVISAYVDSKIAQLKLDKLVSSCELSGDVDGSQNDE
eukprot:CCRYP_009678-RA/>CCRYP_009678-RA protein AED:0.01 eAED:0.01 QI:488/1/1/1/0.5/0.66/3/65/616